MDLDDIEQRQQHYYNQRAGEYELVYSLDDERLQQDLAALAMMVSDWAVLFPCERPAELFWPRFDCFPSASFSCAAATKRADRARSHLMRSPPSFQPLLVRRVAPKRNALAQ